TGPVCHVDVPLGVDGKAARSIDLRRAVPIGVEDLRHAPAGRDPEDSIGAVGGGIEVAMPVERQGKLNGGLEVTARVLSHAAAYAHIPTSSRRRRRATLGERAVPARRGVA